MEEKIHTIVQMSRGGLSIFVLQKQRGGGGGLAGGGGGGCAGGEVGIFKGFF